MLKLDNDYVKINLIDGIYYAYYNPIVINLRIAKEIVKGRQNLTLGKKHPFIVDIREVKGFRMDAVKFLSGNESMDDVNKLAVIVNSKFIVKLYRLISIVAPPRITTNLFTTNKEAKEWILYS
jgi:hypothetical protein